MTHEHASRLRVARVETSLRAMLRWAVQLGAVVLDQPFNTQAIRDAVNACRKVIIDLPLAHKTVVLNELDRWLVAEEATHDSAAAKERRHEPTLATTTPTRSTPLRDGLPGPTSVFHQPGFPVT